jgi:TM2 domain-containing membrane protein YozV
MSYPNPPSDGYGQQPQGQPSFGPQYPYGNSGQAPVPGGYPAPQYPYTGQPAYPVDPSAPYGRDPLTGLPLSDKSKLTAGLLQIFLGGFGVGRFYLGYTTIGVLQLVVSLLTCGVGAIWPLIDGILIIMGNVRDPHGRPLRD